MNTQLTLQQNTIDFCNKWGVEVKNLTLNELDIIFKNERDSLGNEYYKSPFGMHGISWGQI